MRPMLTVRSVSASLATLVAIPSLLAACGAAAPPKELVDARKAYQEASTGPAKDNAPAELHVAKQSLDAAERQFAENGDALETKDQSYIAIRKSQLADATARTIVASKEKDMLEKEGSKYQTDTLKKTQAELQQTKSALQTEKAAREDAEKRAAQALADLQKIASVKKEDRGMVITLSGGVLFKTDKSELMPAAMAQLNQVAEALVRNNPDSRITVEGHTDSQGMASHNKELSQKRAESVATYLASRGIAPDRIKAVGQGPDKPIADNKSVEGRAQNRRVEIIVEPPH